MSLPTGWYAVYILTDDQDIKLGSLDVQPIVNSKLTQQGMFFDNAFVATPVCCPSRSDPVEKASSMPPWLQM